MLEQNYIPTKILKENSEVFARHFHESIIFFENSIFPSENPVLKVVTSAFKKKSKTSKGNWDKSTLPNISKIYERCLYKQIQNYFDEIFSKFQCGFWKGFKAHHCLVNMVERWKESEYNGGAFGTLMTDLFKAFNCLHHYILT